MDSNLKRVYMFEGIAALVQFILKFINIAISSFLGLTPAIAEEYFAVYESDGLLSTYKEAI